MGDVVDLDKKENNGEQTLSMTFTRPSVELGSTIGDVAILINRLREANDPDFIEKTERIVKRLIHIQKLSVYERMDTYFSRELGEDGKSFLKCKLQTHSQLAEELSDA